MAKRESVAEKLKRKLEEKGTTSMSEITEDKPADTSLSENIGLRQKNEPRFLEEIDIPKTEADSVDLPELPLDSVVSESENSVINPNDTTNISDKKTKDDKGVEEDNDVFKKYDRLKVELALAGALKNPRVAAWSPTSAMILNYFKSTRPRSDKSLSSEIDEILAEGLIKRYPKLHQAFQIVINESNSLEITNLKGIRRMQSNRGISPTINDTQDKHQ